MQDPVLFTLVTGASSGIGRSAAVQLSKERRLILHGRNLMRLKETCALCANPEWHLLWTFDLVDLQALSESLQSLLRESAAGIRAFVHAAGVATTVPMRTADLQGAQRTMDINCFSAYEIVRVLLQRKVNGRHLTDILFISSIWSRFGAKGHTAYCASKAAMDGLMRALAVELAPTIRVNSILPGAIRTPMSESTFADPAIVDKLNKDYPMGVGAPQDIAEAIAFVLSPQSRWLTGQELVFDGGRTANMSLS